MNNQDTKLAQNLIDINFQKIGRWENEDNQLILKLTLYHWHFLNASI